MTSDIIKNTLYQLLCNNLYLVAICTLKGNWKYFLYNKKMKNNDNLSYHKTYQ